MRCIRAVVYLLMIACSASAALAQIRPARPLNLRFSNEISANNPYINNGALAYERTNMPDGRWLGNHFDVIVGLNSSYSDSIRAAAVAANPKVQILLYINLNNCTDKDGGFCSWAAAQPNPEKSFIRSTGASVQKISNRLYKRSAGQRMCTNYYTQCEDGGPGSRWITNFLTPESRQDIVNWVKSTWAQRRPNLHGFMIDNSGPGGQGGELVSGTAEQAITAPYVFAGFNSPSEQHQALLLKMLDEQMDSSVTWTSNTANFLITTCSIWTWPGASSGCVPSYNGKTFTYPIFVRGQYERGIFTEFMMRFNQDYSTIDRANLSLKELWESRGSPANAIYYQYWQPGGYGIVPDEDDRIKIWSLSSHLLYQFDRLFYHYHSDVSVSGATPNSSPEKHWFDAQDVRIGTPTSGKTQIDSHAYKRTFSNGISVVRFRASTSDNYTDSATYDLGGTYYPVIRANDNGSGIYGAPVTSVTLRNQEGFIGVKSLP